MHLEFLVELIDEFFDMINGHIVKRNNYYQADSPKNIPDYPNRLEERCTEGAHYAKLKK